MYKVLTIAGSDCSGGAGIQADLKTIMAHGMYGMSVLTAVTAQNTLGVKEVYKLPPHIIESQIAAIAEDIVPDAVKIGMLTDAGTVRAVVKGLAGLQKCPVVIDTVMVSTSGKDLLDRDAVKAYCKELLPLAAIITPNLPELEELYSFVIEDAASCRCRTADALEEMYLEDGVSEKRIFTMAEELQQALHTAVLVKGGHRKDSAKDILFTKDAVYTYPAPHIHNPNTHGTGCTLSSAIACNLARGSSLSEAVGAAKSYISDCIADGMALGSGSGPLNHLVWQQGREDAQV